MEQADRLLNINEVAERLGTSVDFVRKLYNRGGIPVIKVSRKCLRFSEKAIEKYISDNTGTYK